MNPSILLIYPPSNCVSDDRLEPPLGLLYIASTLRQNGFDRVSFLDMSGCKTESQIHERVQNVPHADIYGINSFCTNYAYAKEVINTIRKQNPSAKIVIGGPNPTGAPKFTFN